MDILVAPFRWRALAAAAGLALAALTPAAQAQSVVMAGSYSNFDVLNNTGQETEGFEMEIHGVSKSQLTRIFGNWGGVDVIRYGAGTATDFSGGVYVRWIAPWDAANSRFTTATPVPPSMTSVPGESCWTYGMPVTYYAAGCEHFGISATVNPGTIVYRWLVADPLNPGSVKASNAVVSLPAPLWVATPPANPGLPPVVVAQVEAPAPVVVAQFGEAQWVKVFKTEQPGRVALEDLVGDNHAVVPEAQAQLEVSWSLLQADPVASGNKRQRGKLVNQGNLGNGNHAVVRRYEHYKYAGTYDAITHEALCADLTCTAPSAGEIGDAIGAQNAAANLDTQSLTLAVAGNGSVSSSDRVFKCGSKCYGVYNPGTSVTLTAAPASGASFLAWSGACAGNAPTCTVTLNGDMAATATFSAAGGGGGGGGGGGSTFTLSVSTANPGTVTSTPAGISCGKSCTAKFAPGTVVNLLATPPAGKTFAGWSGACSGTQTVCTVTMSANLKAQAAFTK